MTGNFIQDLYRQGLYWEAVLHYRTQVVTWVEVDGGGRPGQPSLYNTMVQAPPEGGDPVWRPQGADASQYIGEFDPKHRMNLYRFLMRRAMGITQAIVTCDLRGPMAPMGEMAMDAADAWAEDVLDRPMRWLAATPFMMALGALILGDGNREFLELQQKAIDDEAERAERMRL